MASSILGKKDEYRGSERNHPVDAGHLLAIIRDQHLDNEAFVRRHLAECDRCRQTYAELVQTSRTLDALQQMARYQRYPELTSVQVLVKARQSVAQQRSKSYRLPARGVSLPVAVIMIIMTIAIVIALALTQIGKLPSPWNLPGGGGLITTNPVLITEVKEHLPSPTANPKQIATSASGVSVTGSPALTVTPSPASTALAGPHLAACTTAAVDKRNQITAICGYHFPPGDKVTLFVSIYPGGKGVRLTLPVLVDGSGNFIVSYGSRDYFCLFDAVTIYAVDRMSDPPIDVVVYNVSPPGCSSPSMTPMPGLLPTPALKTGSGR